MPADRPHPVRFDAIWLHHLAHAAWRHKIPVVPKLIDLIIFLAFNSTIHHRTVIGAGTMTAHRGIGVVINKDCIIGARVHIGAHVVLGSRRGADPGPIIGDDVFISASSIVLGRIRVGDRVRIGSGAVVIDDVPADTTVVGPKARFLPRA